MESDKSGIARHQSSHFCINFPSPVVGGKRRFASLSGCPGVTSVRDSSIYAALRTASESYLTAVLRSETTVAKNSKVSRAHRDHEKLAAIAEAADAFSARSRGAITR